MSVLQLPDTALAYRLYGADGPRVSLVHGGLVASPSWQHQLVLGERMRLIVHDQRGYGATPYGGPDDSAAMATDLVALWEALDARDIVVVGFSMGTMVALEAAALAPERVKSIVLVSGGLLDAAGRELFAARSAEMAGGDFAATVADHAKRAFSPAWVEAHPAEIEAYGAQAATADPRAVAQTFAWISRWELPESLPDVPVLLVNGSLDKLFTPAAAQALAARLKDARTEVLDGAGHTLHMEQPGRFNALLEDVA